MRGNRAAEALGAALALGALLAALGAAPAATAAPPCTEGSWCERSLSPDARATLLLEELTLDEKLSLMGGDDPSGVFTGEPANGTSDGVPRLGIPTLYFNDGPAGIRKGEATGMPAPIALAANFSPLGARRYGAALGREAFAKGIMVTHAPAVNIARTPLGGRTFEYYGEDPLLAARTAVRFIRGQQAQGVMSNVKHYAANNQETNRFTVNAIVDERTLREIYLRAFEASVRKGGVASVMLAYNRVNGRKVTDNAELVNGILKRDFGFRGFALTDYGFAQDSTADAANAGTDLEMPQAFWYSRANLQLAVDSGEVAVSTIDDHVHRILREMFRFGIFDRRWPDAHEPDDEAIPVRRHARVARRVERQGIVLLKNSGGLLPLRRERLDSIAVIGPEADSYRNGGGSSAVEPFYAITPFEGIERRARSAGIEARLDDGSSPAGAAQLAGELDVAIVVVNDNMTEFIDKPCLSLQCGDPANGDQDGLIEAVAAANPSTIVVLETGGPVLMPWIDRVPAVLEAWYPGQEGGNAIAAILFGDADPGGRLPITFPRREEDTPTAGHPERYPGVAENAQYSEGVFVGYRHYDENGIEPLFPFGHGLSYTSFHYSGLELRPVRPGGGVRVGLEVENTGRRRGSEVVQLYTGLPDVSPSVQQPPRTLTAYRRISLHPGERRDVSFHLNRRAFAYWDARRDRWTVEPGCYRIEAGRSSRDIRLHESIGRGGANCGRHRRG